MGSSPPVLGWVVQAAVVASGIQTVGLLALAVLIAMVARSLRDDSMRSWAQAWGLLACALLLLQVSFGLPALTRLIQTGYHFCGVAFLLLLIRGCRQYGGVPDPPLRPWLAAAAAYAVVLPWLSDSFPVRFAAHAGVLAAGFARAFFVLRAVRGPARVGLGVRVTLWALALLALDFCHYAPLLALSRLGHVQLATVYLGYTSLYDLLLEMVLAFGLVAIGLERARRRAEDAHAALSVAHQKLQQALSQIRMLSGLLPVCAWCRRVRDDGGYWSELETYVRQHSDADFTHGICPSCRAAHFPAQTHAD